MHTRFTIARLLDSRFAVHLLSALVLGCLVFAGGFVAKSFSPDLTWWEVARCFNVEHLVYGSTLTGVGSLLGWLISLLGGGGGWWLRTLDLGGTGRLGGGGGGNDKAGKIILAVLVVVGICLAFKWIYDYHSTCHGQLGKRMQNVTEKPSYENGDNETRSAHPQGANGKHQISCFRVGK